MKRGIAMLGLLALCAGCFGLGSREAGERPATFRLTPPSVEAASGTAPGAGSLGVTRPRTAPALDTADIAVQRPGQSFDYYSGARWVESAPAMLQQLLVQTLASSGIYSTVVSAPSRVNVEHLLDVELRRFEAVAAGDAAAPRVRVQLQVTLIDAREGRRLGSALADAEASAADNRRGAVIEAFEQATSAALLDVVAHVRESAAQAPAAPAATDPAAAR
jgi:cholesterol transport system auxiliary component